MRLISLLKISSYSPVKEDLKNFSRINNDIGDDERGKQIMKKRRQAEP
ncbi:hypothetical protein AAGT10_14825 (plasmid) [Sulfolobus tengchongensis]|uniref:Uncharacterized protein n=1 Tax=Sulfolobus tengchongensis TaxID=207809 RepID=A0AAX4KZZ4_9CREN